MAETQTWRIDTNDRVREVVVTHTEHGAWADPDGHLGASARIAVQAWAYRNSVMGAILAPGEPTRAELAAQLAAVTRERDVLRAQQAPLVACVDALRAAATAAGWRDADATGETLVAWVRRGAMRECLAIEAPKVRALRTAVNALCNVRTLRATCAEGETWRAHVHDKDWTDARTNALAVLNATGGES